ncbi:MAG: hypothetical protein ABH883_01015 [Candidatus Omnitrophota bacterium]
MGKAEELITKDIKNAGNMARQVLKKTGDMIAMRADSKIYVLGRRAAGTLERVYDEKLRIEREKFETDRSQKAEEYEKKKTEVERLSKNALHKGVLAANFFKGRAGIEKDMEKARENAAGSFNLICQAISRAGDLIPNGELIKIKHAAEDLLKEIDKERREAPVKLESVREYIRQAREKMVKVEDGPSRLNKALEYIYYAVAVDSGSPEISVFLEEFADYARAYFNGVKSEKKPAELRVEISGLSDDVEWIINETAVATGFNDLGDYIKKTIKECAEEEERDKVVAVNLSKVRASTADGKVRMLAVDKIRETLGNVTKVLEADPRNETALNFLETISQNARSQEDMLRLRRARNEERLKDATRHRENMRAKNAADFEGINFDDLDKKKESELRKLIHSAKNDQRDAMRNISRVGISLKSDKKSAAAVRMIIGTQRRDSFTRYNELVDSAKRAFDFLEREIKRTPLNAFELTAGHMQKLISMLAYPGVADINDFSAITSDTPGLWKDLSAKGYIADNGLISRGLDKNTEEALIADFGPIKGMKIFQKFKARSGYFTREMLADTAMDIFWVKLERKGYIGPTGDLTVSINAETKARLIGDFGEICGEKTFNIIGQKKTDIAKADFLEVSIDHLMDSLCSGGYIDRDGRVFSIQGVSDRQLKLFLNKDYPGSGEKLFDLFLKLYEYKNESDEKNDTGDISPDDLKPIVGNDVNRINALMRNLYEKDYINRDNSVRLSASLTTPARLDLDPVYEDKGVRKKIFSLLSGIQRAKKTRLLKRFDIINKTIERVITEMEKFWAEYEGHRKLLPESAFLHEVRSKDEVNYDAIRKIFANAAKLIDLNEGERHIKEKKQDRKEGAPVLSILAVLMGFLSYAYLPVSRTSSFPGKLAHDRASGDGYRYNDIMFGAQALRTKKVIMWMENTPRDLDISVRAASEDKNRNEGIKKKAERAIRAINLQCAIQVPREINDKLAKEEAEMSVLLRDIHSVSERYGRKIHDTDRVAPPSERDEETKVRPGMTPPEEEEGAESDVIFDGKDDGSVIFDEEEAQKHPPDDALTRTEESFVENLALARWDLDMQRNVLRYLKKKNHKKAKRLINTAYESKVKASGKSLQAEENAALSEQRDEMLLIIDRDESDFLARLAVKSLSKGELANARTAAERALTIAERLRDENLKDKIYGILREIDIKEGEVIEAHGVITAKGALEVNMPGMGVRNKFVYKYVKKENIDTSIPGDYSVKGIAGVFGGMVKKAATRESLRGLYERYSRLEALEGLLPGITGEHPELKGSAIEVVRDAGVFFAAKRPGKKLIINAAFLEALLCLPPASRRSAGEWIINEDISGRDGAERGFQGQYEYEIKRLSVKRGLASLPPGDVI